MITPQYNLSYLSELRDPKNVSALLQLFIRITPALIEEIRVAAACNNWEEVYQKSHKLKSSLGILQMEELLVSVASVEMQAKHRIDLDKIPVAVQKIKNSFAFIIPKLEEDLHKSLEKISEITIHPL